MWMERSSTISGKSGDASHHEWLVERELARIRPIHKFK